MNRTIIALVAAGGFLIPAALVGAQSPDKNQSPNPLEVDRERRVDALRRVEPVDSATKPAAPTDDKRPETEKEKSERADRDLGTAASTYERVYDRLSYGDGHLVKQLETNKQRRLDIQKRLEQKRQERVKLEDRVADQFDLIRKRYPPPESNEIVVELAHEYDATKRALDDEIVTLNEDLKFADERIAAVRKQLRRVQARSIGRDVKAKVAGNASGADPEPSIEGKTFAQLERLRQRVIRRRVLSLNTLELSPFDPASCGREGDFRTRVFQAVR